MDEGSALLLLTRTVQCTAQHSAALLLCCTALLLCCSALLPCSVAHRWLQWVLGPCKFLAAVAAASSHLLRRSPSLALLPSLMPHLCPLIPSISYTPYPLSFPLLSSHLLSSPLLSLQVLNLPEGSTVVDYAYHIHTDLGNRMIAAKVKGWEEKGTERGYGEEVKGQR